MEGSQNFITFIPRAFLFVNEDKHLILVLLRKVNLEQKEICASDLLKPLISMLLTHIHFGFSCFTFYPTDNSTGWGQNGTCPIFTPGVSCFYPKLWGKNEISLKAIFSKPLSVP